MGRIGLILGIVIALALVLAGADFLAYVDRADKAEQASAPAGADAVVALTGSSDARIVAGVKLSAELGLPLLISGVHVDATAKDIARIARVSEGEIKRRATLGYAAATTAGNGEEVADWAREHKFRHIVVVTSNYHMDRALFELSHAMPEAQFLPYAVRSTRVAPRSWYSDGNTTRRLLEEWAKFRMATLMTGTAVKPKPVQPGAAQPASVNKAATSG